MQVLKTTKQDSDSLTQRVYKDLRTAIITGNITGGTRLVESTLAANMQVSRTPVREALHKLALEGLLYSIPRAGYIVEEMSDYDIQDLFTTRMTIEQIAARLAMEKISEEELEQLALEALDGEPARPARPLGQLELKRKPTTPREICERVITEHAGKQKSA